MRHEESRAIVQELQGARVERVEYMATLLVLHIEGEEQQINIMPARDGDGHVLRVFKSRPPRPGERP